MTLTWKTRIDPKVQARKNFGVARVVYTIEGIHPSMLVSLQRVVLRQGVVWRRRSASLRRTEM